MLPDQNFFNSVRIALDQTMPARVPQGPASPSWHATNNTPARPVPTDSGVNVLPGQYATWELDQCVKRVSDKLKTVLQPGVPAQTQMLAAATATLLQKMKQSYTAQLNNDATAWNHHAVRYGTQPWRALAYQLDEAADHLRTAAAAAAGAGASAPKATATAGMGVWSWNPNEWGMSADEAQAYETAQANTQVALAAAAAKAKALDPSLSDTLTQGLQGITKSATSAAQWAMFLGVLAAGGIGYAIYKGAQDEKTRGKMFDAAGKVASTGAQVAGRFTGSAAKGLLI